MSQLQNISNIEFIGKFRFFLPNVNSLVNNPDAERAATKAEGPGMGITRIFSLTQLFVYKSIRIVIMH